MQKLFRMNHRTAQPSLQVGTRQLTTSTSRGWFFPLSRQITGRNVLNSKENIDTRPRTLKQTDKKQSRTHWYATLSTKSAPATWMKSVSRVNAAGVSGFICGWTPPPAGRGGDTPGCLLRDRCSPRRQQHTKEEADWGLKPSIPRSCSRGGCTPRAAVSGGLLLYYVML